MEQSEQVHRAGTGIRAHRQLEELAKHMACLAHKIRDLAIAAFENGTASSAMRDICESFREVLNSDLPVAQFCDMFAQTLTYGLFAARYIQPDSTYFQSRGDIGPIPHTSSFLKQLSGTTTWAELGNEPFTGYVDELVRLVAETDIHKVLENCDRGPYREDPLIYFYETFLEQYDPRLRDLRGVYYTPEPVVSYMVRSVDFLLRSHFNYQDHSRVTLLDPACGSGVFLHAVIKHVRDTFRQTGSTGRWPDYVHEHLLPHLFGFELLMAPYMMAHLKLGAQLAALDLPESERHNWAYNFEEGERLNIYLANTLDKVESVLHYGKRDVLIILGNPPYVGHSLNKGKWITGMLKSYKEGCQELKKPAQAKWLSDDYVKFIRFAQWHIEQTGHGILAFVTSHSYLDNPTFRGMRRSLLQSFDDIYILDLHGNSKKKELAPGGSRDENVFDIQQGVAISIFVKWQDAPDEQASFAAVHHADLWGLREVYEPDTRGHLVLTGGKHFWLAEHELASTPWTPLNPQAPFYLFTPRDNQYLAEYEAGWSVPAIFWPNGDPAPGIVTCHDQFAISWTKQEASDKVERFLSTRTEDEARRLFRLCSQDQWQYDAATSELRQGIWQSESTEILYRPFDRRWTVFNRHVAVHRRERVMRHMLAGENIGLTIGRAGQVIDQGEWDIVFCTRYISVLNLFRRGGNNLFPLYLYGGASTDARRANLAPEFISAFASRLGMNWAADGRGDLRHTFGPEDVLAYMYAVFYSPAYRQRYSSFLKIDFPRLPLTANTDLFRELCKLGEKLIGLHLMEEHIPVISNYPMPGDNRVETVRYTLQSERKAMGRLWINATQYFDDVPLVAWRFSIGGYQICNKWLKDRKGRRLSDDELVHYQQIIAILAETSRLMCEIDRVVEKYGGWPI